MAMASLFTAQSNSASTQQRMGIKLSTRTSSATTRKEIASGMPIAIMVWVGRQDHWRIQRWLLNRLEEGECTHSNEIMINNS